MQIAIVIPAYNVAPFLSDAIRSVLGQTHAGWSLIVIDDGSTDSTASVASRFRDPRIRLIRQPNCGVSAARNAGIALALMAPAPAVTAGGAGSDPAIHPPTATGLPSPPPQTGPRRPSTPSPDALLFLDADDWLAPDSLTRLANALNDAPWAVASAGRYARVGLNGARRLSRRPPQGCLLERLLTRNLFANGGHLLIRREAIETAGGFRTDLTYGEDWEYWTRLALLGEFVSEPSRDPLLFVRERPGSTCLLRAADPEAYRPAIGAIHRLPTLEDRLGRGRLVRLGQRAEAEMAWTVGREMIRHGRRRDGLRWLGRSIRAAPAPKRVLLMGLSWLRFGPFRPYGTLS
ncbi:MAG TPA: glycosyltransferase [Rhodopila sp.]|nr:glycosyltransferase [Rhodopila sp.]